MIEKSKAAHVHLNPWHIVVEWNDVSIPLLRKGLILWHAEFNGSWAHSAPNRIESTYGEVCYFRSDWQHSCNLFPLTGNRFLPPCFSSFLFFLMPTCTLIQWGKWFMFGYKKRFFKIMMVTIMVYSHLHADWLWERHSPFALCTFACTNQECF